MQAIRCHFGSSHFVSEAHTFLRAWEIRAVAMQVFAAIPSGETLSLNVDGIVDVIEQVQKLTGIPAEEQVWVVEGNLARLPSGPQSARFKFRNLACHTGVSILGVVPRGQIRVSQSGPPDCVSNLGGCLPVCQIRVSQSGRQIGFPICGAGPPTPTAPTTPHEDPHIFVNYAEKTILHFWTF